MRISDWSSDVCSSDLGCELNRGLSVVDYIHKGCCHVESAEFARLADIRRRAVGDPEMYRKHSYLTVNGLPPTSGGKLVSVAKLAPVFPPNLGGMRDYNEKEEFHGGDACGNRGGQEKSVSS